MPRVDNPNIQRVEHMDALTPEQRATMTPWELANRKRIVDNYEFQKRLNNAIRVGETNANSYFTQRGLDPSKYTDLINSILGETKAKVPKLDENPNAYFGRDTFAAGLSEAEALKRQNLTGQVNSTFNPGFERSLIGDTADDSIIDSILGTQRAQALQQIDFNKARGLLNDSGYTAVMNELGGQESAARSTLTGIGDSILGKGRQDLLNIRGEAGNAASGYQFGQDEPNVGDYFKQAGDKATNYLSGLEGSIRGALGSTNLFDVPTLLQKGGTAQGPINLTTANSDTSLPFDPKRTSSRRGLGSTGVF